MFFMKKRSFSIALLLCVAFVFVLFLVGIFSIVNIGLNQKGESFGSGGVDEDEAEGTYLSPTYDHYRVFVSSSTSNGDIGGIVGADTLCQNVANTAGLGGNWKAWLSNSTTSASSRLLQSTLVYKRIDGQIVADNWNDLTDGSLQNSISVTENNQSVGGLSVWTGTNFDGSSNFTDCGNWTAGFASFSGVQGITVEIDQYWTETNPLFGPSTCNQQHNLYCFEQPSCGNGITENTEMCDDGNLVDGDGCASLCVTEPYYRVFVTDNSYLGNLGGLSGADQICSNSASNAGLGTNWKAWLSDSSISASSRLYHSTYNYQRMDGKIIANNWSDLTDGSLINRINVTESLIGLLSNNYVWTGTWFDGSPYNDNCFNWTSSSSNFGGRGNTRFADSGWTEESAFTCGQ